MILGQKGVKYGLQVRKPEKASKSVSQPKPNIFGDEASDSEEDNVEKKILRHAARKQSDKKVRWRKLDFFYSIHVTPLNFVLFHAGR